MTDDLIARLRLLQRYHGDNDAGEAADALEAQARRIEELEEDIDRDDEWAKGFIEKTDARIAALEAALMRIGQPGKQIVYCRDGHEEAVLLARAAYMGEKND